MKCISILLFVFAIGKLGFCQIPHQHFRANAPEWEEEYQERLRQFLYAQGTFKPSSGNSYPDEGKTTWSSLLAELWKNQQDAEFSQYLIDTVGGKLLTSTWAGSLYKPFSVPGYAMFYLQYKNRIADHYKKIVRDSLYSNGWSYLMRTDRLMDPIYQDTEFNSENFNWMMRMGGYLLAEDFNDAEKLPYFDNHIQNWIRALYNVGRVEWNSNNYWGHCFNPIMVLYIHAKNKQVKQRAQAGMDWMLTEAALHYLDGFLGGGDVRAKNTAYQPFSGSVWGYCYLYFTDKNHYPTYTRYFGNPRTVHLKEYIGFAPYSDYRPPLAVIDLAQRNFPLPVEIQSAKPFYHLDNDNYADWKGQTEKSRRFEFETIWMDENLLLASLASNRPDGANRCKQHMTYSEESLWRLMAKGTNKGAVQIFGNTSAFTHMTGRDPHEEIGQFRNVMIRMVKNTPFVWVAVPREVKTDYDKQNIFLDFGNGSYAAFIAYRTEERQTEVWDVDRDYLIHRWGCSPNGITAIITEVGTSKQFGSFENFKRKIRNTDISLVAEDKIRYESASKHTIEMEYQPTTTYLMAMGCEVNPAGVTPKLWANGQFVDYNTWEPYRTSYGYEVITQKRGEGKLTIKTPKNKLEISVNPQNSEVTYRPF